MAKAYAHCATEGCTNQILLFGINRTQADGKAAWAEKNGMICDTCKAKQRDKENRLSAEQNAEDGLPELKGSEKQIAWAETIRAEKLAQIEGDSSMLAKQTSASWWIEHRNHSARALLEIESRLAEKEIVFDVKVEAEIEATIKAEEPKTNTIAEISILEKTLVVTFPEKLNDFRLLIRSHGFTWFNNKWAKKLTKWNGNPKARAAEIGREILADGYSIRIYDEEIRDMVINGSYEIEKTRWITLYSPHLLQISWGRNDDCYYAAKALPTAKYVKPNITVAVEQFEQVLDFAQINNFLIDDEAQKAIDIAREVKINALILCVEKQPKKVRQRKKPKIEALAVPEIMEIDNEFID